MNRLRTALVALMLTFGPAAVSVFAQEAPATGEEGAQTSSGDPLYGYVGTAFLAAGVMFVLCKSARR